MALNSRFRGFYLLQFTKKSYVLQGFLHFLNAPLTCEKLFNVIDVMPMRKNELLEKIRNKTQNYP